VAAQPSELPQASADLVVDAAGFEATWRASLSLARAGSDIVIVGLGQADGPFPMAGLIRRGLRLRGQFAYSRADFATALEVLGQGDLDLPWLTVSSLADGAQAFDRLVNQPERYTKIALVPGGA
jgi:threonine dehydrogenase-like Zn-dependent dehydrogenase